MDQDLAISQNKMPDNPPQFSKAVWRSLSDNERAYVLRLIDYYELNSKEPKSKDATASAECDRPLYVESRIELTEELMVKIGKAIQNLKI